MIRFRWTPSSSGDEMVRDYSGDWLMRFLILLCTSLLLMSGAPSFGNQQPASPSNPANMTDEQIRQAIIRQSIASYAGNCPCPYNTDRAGRRCGARSAYSRPGGASPKCFASDVSDAEVQRYRQARQP